MNAALSFTIYPVLLLKLTIEIFAYFYLFPHTVVAVDFI